MLIFNNFDHNSKGKNQKEIKDHFDYLENFKINDRFGSSRNV